MNCNHEKICDKKTAGYAFTCAICKSIREPLEKQIAALSLCLAKECAKSRVCPGRHRTDMDCFDISCHDCLDKLVPPDWIKAIADANDGKTWQQVLEEVSGE